MDDKTIMENLLFTAKETCDLYMHGAIESNTTNVNSAFDSALRDSLCIQDEIYKKMAAMGWYPTEQADSNKISAVKQKFAGK